MLKKYLATLYFLLLMLLLMSDLHAQHITGSGSSSDPYVLYNAADIDSIRYLGVTNDYYYELGGNVDFSSFGTYTPITSNGFNLNGNGYEISNIDFNKQKVVGLIDTLFIGSGDTVRFEKIDFNNILFVQDSSLSITSPSNEYVYFGLIAGSVFGSTSGTGLYINKIKVNNLTMWQRIQGAAYTGGASLIGKIEDIRYVNFYQVKVDSTLIYNINTNGTISLSYSGGIMAEYSDDNANELSSFYAKEVGVSNSNIMSYDWDDRCYSSAMFGFIPSEPTVLIEDVYVVNSKVGGSNNYDKRIGTIGTFGSLSTEDSLKKYFISEVLPTTSISGTLTGTNSNRRTLIISSVSGTVINESGYVDTTNLFRYDSDNYYFADASTINEYPSIHDISSLKLSSTFTDFNFNDIWSISESINNGYPYHKFSSYNETIIEILEPLSMSVIFNTDSLSFSVETQNVDSVIFSYSEDEGENYTIINGYPTNGLQLDTLIIKWLPTGLAGSTILKIEAPNNFLEPYDTVKVLIYNNNRSIRILTPTETQQLVNNGLLSVQVESQYLDYFDVQYSYGDSNYILIYDSLLVSVGDGNIPDTTNFNIVLSEILTGVNPITLRVSSAGDSIITGSMTEPYFDSEFEVAGSRAYLGSGQAVNYWSNFYVYAAELYTVSFFGFVWGWYDYSDAIYFYKWNKASDIMELAAKRPTPSSAFYPHINVYRSSQSKLIMYNPNANIYKYNDLTLPLGASTSWSGTISQTPPGSIDEIRSSYIYEGWNYELNRTSMKLYASDLNNFGNIIYIADLSDYLTSENAEYIVFDDHILISKRTGTSTVWIVGSSFPESDEIMVDDIVTFIPNKVTSNIFRGIYPKAIIEVIPKEQ